MVKHRSPKPQLGVRVSLPLLLRITFQNPYKWLKMVVCEGFVFANIESTYKYSMHQ